MARELPTAERLREAADYVVLLETIAEAALKSRGYEFGVDGFKQDVTESARHKARLYTVLDTYRNQVTPRSDR